MGRVFVYAEVFGSLRIPKAQVTLFGNGGDETFPALCSFADGKKCGVATEYDEDDECFIVTYDKNKTFASTFFDDAKLPSKIGEPLYIDSAGKLTKEKASNLFVGEFVGKIADCVLFRLN